MRSGPNDVGVAAARSLGRLLGHRRSAGILLFVVLLKLVQVLLCFTITLKASGGLLKIVILRFTPEKIMNFHATLGGLNLDSISQFDASVPIEYPTPIISQVHKILVTHLPFLMGPTLLEIHVDGLLQVRRREGEGEEGE